MLAAAFAAQDLFTYLHQASPILLMIIGALLFLFAGALKWVVKAIGVFMIIYGILSAVAFS